MKERMMKKFRALICMLAAVSMLIPSTYTQAASSTNDQVIYSDLSSYGYVTGTTPDTSTESADATFEDIADEKAGYLLDVYGITSLQIAIIHNDNVVLSKGYGYQDVQAQAATDNDTIYGMGSISKMFTTTAVMQLVDQGKVDLDKPVTDYITDFKMADSRYKNITVRMLLNHSSGLMGSSMGKAVLLGTNNTVNHDEFLTTLSTQYLKYAPGTLSVYCNDGFTLAEILVERVSEMTFTDYIEKAISTPLGLENINTPQSDFDRTKMAKTYYSSTEATPYESVNIIGAGGMTGTAEDLCKFGDIFMNNNTILSASAKKQMAYPEYQRGLWTSEVTGALAYGLGWDSMQYAPYSNYGIAAYNKGGDTIFYHGTMTVLPEKNITIAVLSSGGTSGCLSLYADSVLMKYLEENNMIHPTEGTTTTYETTELPADINDWVGSYDVAYGTNTKVSLQDGKLVINCLGVDWPVQYTTSGYYVNEDQSIKFRLTKKNNKQYVELKAASVYPYLGSVELVVFVGQKLTDNPLTASVKKVWQNREGKKYYVVSEGYASYIYLINLNSLCFSGAMNTDAEGYFSNMKIINKNLAYCSLEIPGIYGRDGTQTNFFKKNGVEYATCSGSTYMSEDGFKTLPNKTKMTVSIPATGYNTYYKVSTKTANKKATVTVPANASFVVYDKDGNVVTNYYLNKKKTVTLPEGGNILFVGSKNAKFTVTLK